MLNDLKALYVAVKDDQVVYFETNLSSFIEGFRKVQPELKSYSYYTRAFKEKSVINFMNSKREVFTLQKVL